MTEKYYKAEELIKTFETLRDNQSAYGMHDKAIDTSYYIQMLLDYPTVEADIDELKKEVEDLNNRRHLIWAIGCDYDGCNTVDSLKELIDELVSYTQLPREQVPDITSRTGRWIDVPDYGGSGWQIQGKPVSPKYCSLCGDSYSKAYNYCPNCGAKMIKESEND
jgi:hypothetical protein